MGSPVEVVTQFLRSFTGNDPDAIASLVSEGFRNDHASELGSGCVGRDEYRRRLPHFLGAFVDRSYTIDDIVSERREACSDVVVRYRFRATYNEMPIDICGVMWFSVADGMITRRIDTWDSLTFLRQSGADLNDLGGTTD